MPNPPVPLTPIALDQLHLIAGLPKLKEHEDSFPKRAASSTSDARAALKRWQVQQPEPKAVRNPEVPLKAVQPSKPSFDHLRAISRSETAPSTMLERKVNVETLFGVVFSAITVHAYMQLEAEHRRRLATAGNKEATEKRWQKLLQQFQDAFEKAGLPGVTEDKLNAYLRELNSNKENLNAVTDIMNSARPTVGAPAASAQLRPVASIVPTVAKFIDTSVAITPIADLCSKPFAQGSFTKHFSYAVSLSISIPYPCGISWSGIKWCHKTVTVAGVSFGLDVNVGYKVTCCGATAWGQAVGQACATIVGQSVCATCTATITGVAGVSRTPVGSSCNYGVGISAELTCSLAGHTILDVSYPFGWTVSAPCPPVALCA